MALHIGLNSAAHAGQVPAKAAGAKKLAIVRAGFSDDVEAVRAGKLDFGVMAKRHERLLIRIIGTVCSQAMLATSDNLQDFLQEARLALALAIKKWDPDHPAKMSLGVYVRGEVFNYVRAYKRNMRVYARYMDEFKSRYIQNVITEELVYEPPMNQQVNDNAMVTRISLGDYEAADARRDGDGVLAGVLGQMRSADARVVAAWWNGRTLGEAAECIYTERDTFGLKQRAARRAFATATHLVKCSRTPEE